MGHEMTTEALEGVCPFLLRAVHNVLAARDIHDVLVEEIRFKVAPRSHLAIQVISDCPAGTRPTYECTELPGGGVSCKMVCK